MKEIRRGKEVPIGGITPAPISEQPTMITDNWRECRSVFRRWPRWPPARFLSPSSTLREAPAGAPRRGGHPDEQMAFHADAHSANGAFHPSTNFPAIGARTNARTWVRRVQAMRAGRGACARTTWRRSRRRLAEGPDRERTCIRRLTDNWRQPPKTPIRGMAPSRYPRISRQMALAPIAGSCATECRQVIQVEAVAPGPNGGNNAREWRAVSEGEQARTGRRPAIGAFHPYEVELNR